MGLPRLPPALGARYCPPWLSSALWYPPAATYRLVDHRAIDSQQSSRQSCAVNGRPFPTGPSAAPPFCGAMQEPQHSQPSLRQVLPRGHLASVPRRSLCCRARLNGWLNARPEPRGTPYSTYLAVSPWIGLGQKLPAMSLTLTPMPQ